jgi:hypothetical protein
MIRKEYWVYKIISPSNKEYIGITSNIVKRFCIYKNNLCVNQPAIYNSLLKYGWDNHTKLILFISLTQKEAIEIEKKLIKESKEKKNSLNISDGGLYNNHKKINLEDKKSKQVLQFTIKGEFLREWISINEIEYALPYNSNNIGKVCRNLTFYQHGFLWIFKKDYESGIIPEYHNKIGKGRSKKIVQKDINNKILNSYASVKEAIKNYVGKNAKKNIYSSLKYDKLDANNHHWCYE